MGAAPETKVLEPLTREDLRDELQRFATDTLQQELPGILTNCLDDLREELQTFFVDLDTRSKKSPETDLPSAGLQPNCCEVPLGPRPTPSVDLPLWRGSEASTNKDTHGCQLSQPWEGEEDRAQETDKVDRECSLRPEPHFEPTPLQGSPLPEANSASWSFTGWVANELSELRTEARRESQASRMSRHRYPSHSSHHNRATSRSRRASRASSGRASAGTDKLRVSEIPSMFQSSMTPPPGAAGVANLRRHWRYFPGALVAKGEMVKGDLGRSSVSSNRARNSMIGSGCGPIKTLVDSPYFDYGCGVLIILHAASIGVQTDFMARNLLSAAPAVFRGIELMFCTIFTAELLLRIHVHRLQFFWAPEWAWNVFDVVLVLLQLLEESATLYTYATQRENPFSDQGPGNVNTDFSVMRILRILRLIRIIRLVRILRLIGELRTIVVSIAGSLRSLCWTVLLLLMMMYLLGVYLTQLILDYRVEHNLLEPGDDCGEATHCVQHFFGSLGMAMLSLYQAITGGLNWHLIVDSLMTQISPWMSIIIGFYIAFSLFALMNVVTGVFVESALGTARSDKDMFMLQFVRKLFHNADKDGSGSITWDEFKACLGSKEMQMYFEQFDLDIHEAKNLFHLLDSNGSGEVDFDEFVNGCFRLRGQAKALDLATFMSGFSTWSNEWLRFARRVDWQLRTVMKRMNISMKEAPRFDASDSSPTSAGTLNGLPLLTPDQQNSFSDTATNTFDLEFGAATTVASAMVETMDMVVEGASEEDSGGTDSQRRARLANFAREGHGQNYAAEVISSTTTSEEENGSDSDEDTRGVQAHQPGQGRQQRRSGRAQPS